MDLKTPFRYIKDNLLLTKDGEVWAYYKVKSKFIATANYETKNSYKKDFRSFMDQLVQFYDFEFSMYPVDMDLSNRFNEIESDFDKDLFHVADYYAKETVHLLHQELGMITRNEFVIGVKLREIDIEDVSLKGYVKNTVIDFSDKLLTSVGLEASIDEKVISRYKVLEEEMYVTMANVNADRLSEDELSYFNRLNYISNNHHDVVEQSKKKSFTSLSNSVFDPYFNGVIKVNNDYEEFYKTHLVVDDFPLDMKYTHIFEKLQNLNFPVKVDIKCQTTPSDKLSKKVHRAKVNLGQQTNERLQAGDYEEQDVVDNLYVLNEMENEIKHNDNFMNWICIITITDEDKNIVKRKASKVIDKLEKNNIEVVRPLADQINLLYQSFPAQKLIMNKYWNQITNSDGFSENLFGVSQKLGTNTGFYIGRIDKFTDRVDRNIAVASSRDIVLFNPIIAAQGVKGAKSASPHIQITGETGKGKSFLAKLIFMYTAFFDCKIAYFDPKSEMFDWFNQVLQDEHYQKEYPFFIEMLEKINYITLDYTKESNVGILDPIVYLDKDGAVSTLRDIIFNLRKINDIHIENAINKEINNIAEQRQKGHRVGSLNVFENLMNNYEDRDIVGVGELFLGMTKSSLLKLVFSDGRNESLNLKDKINIIQIKGLDLPDIEDSSDEYKESEKASMSVFVTLGKFLEEFNNDRKEHTVTFIDEGWVFTRSSAGRKQKKNLTKTGRSLLNTLVFISQSVKDGGSEDDEGNFGSYFCFDLPKERKDILDTLNLEYSETETENLDILDNLSIGQCLFQDIYGRTGVLTVDCLFSEMEKAFKTLDKNKSAVAEEKFG